MASDPFLSADHIIELNGRLTAATQRALTQEDKKNTKRAYGPKQREFIVYCCSSYPRADEELMPSLGMVQEEQLQRRRPCFESEDHPLPRGRGAMSDIELHKDEAEDEEAACGYRGYSPHSDACGQLN
jgi:hypothetical protein